MTNNRKYDRALFFFIQISIFIAVFFMSTLFPYAVDDLWYSGGLHTSNPIEALALTTDKLYDFYFGWSGRLVGNFFAFFMVIMNKMVFNVSNAVMHVSLGTLMYKFATSQKWSPIILLFIYLSLWLFTPEYGMVLIWTNATTIYMWAQLPLLLFAYVYFKTIEEPIHESENVVLGKKVLFCVGMLLLGVLAGNSMEPTAATMAIVGFFWLVRCLKTKRGVRLWESFGIVGFFIGFAILIFSPGSGERAKVVRDIVGNQNPVKEILFRFIRESYYTAKFMSLAFGLSLALWIVSCGLHMLVDNAVDVKENGSVLRRFISLRWKEPLFIFAALSSIYMMTFSIAFANRVFLAPTVLLIISMAVSVNEIAITLKKMMDVKIYNIFRIAMYICLAFVLMFVATQYVTAMIEMYKSGEPFIKTTIFVEYNQDLF